MANPTLTSQDDALTLLTHSLGRRHGTIARAGATLGALGLLFSLTACAGDGSADDAAEGEVEDETDEDADGEDGDDEQDDGAGETEPETLTSTGGTYSWEVPAGLSVVTHELEESDLDWADGEEEQSYAVQGDDGAQLASISINTATDNDGPLPLHVETIDSEEIPSAEQPDSETWLRTVVSSLCFEGEEADPEHCDYRLSMSLVSLGENQDLEDFRDVWFFDHEVEGEENAGNVVMYGSLPTADQPLNYDEAVALQESEEYQRLREMFASFALHNGELED